MLNLTLRDEFLGAQMPGTAISLRRQDNTGAAQQGPEQILAITYPTADVQTALRAVSDKRAQRPIVLLGDRGRGKSHIMAVMHHAIQSPEQVEAWAREWGKRPGMEGLRDLSLQRGFVAISEPVQNQEYPLLWELLFDRHPKGEFFRGKFQQMNRPYPPRSLLEEMFEAQPVALILDEFQKWFDGLSDEPGPTGRKWREVASNFIQNLSEMASERPDLVILVISVLNNNTEAFRQVHRNNPVLIDFRGPSAKHDRQRLLLHRLFKNRGNIPDADIANLTAPYAGERFRLRFPQLSDAERNRIATEVADCWPFSPELIEALEDHILLAEAAQETRDLIRILASVYRVRGDQVPLITPADFFVDDDASGVQSLLDSIATSGIQEALREIAQRNLENVKRLGISVPQARELMSALWMRSMSPLRNIGATRQELQLDLTRGAPQDDNAFRSELTLLIDNSINIHGDESPDGRLWFGPGENARTKVRATARNDKLWTSDSPGTATQTAYPGKDIEHTRNTLRHILVPETKQAASRIIVLGPNWSEDPWGDVEDADKPERWEQPVLIVIPAMIGADATSAGAVLGPWLAKNVAVKRNTVRFLLAGTSTSGIYDDPSLVFAARCSYLTSQNAWGSDAQYRGLHQEFDKPLRDTLKSRYDRFARLRQWDYRNPSQCVFDIERIDARGGDIPSAVEAKIVADLFDPAEFERFVLQHAKELRLVGDLLKELAEPPPSNTLEAIPYLGDTAIYEEILKVAAKGNVVLNVGGTWVGRSPDHIDDDTALRAIRARAFRSGQEMRQVQLGLPSAMGGTTVTSLRPPAPLPPPVSVPPTSPETTLPPNDSIIPPTISQTTITPAAPAAALKTQRTDAPATGINLSGYFERWEISADKTLTSTKVEFTNLTVQQVKQILQRLPSSVRAVLEIVYSDEDES